MAAGPYEATIGAVRSFDGGVFITLTNGTVGWTITDGNPKLHAIAAAAQATGKKVWVTYDSHDPNWPPGPQNVGYFYGVKMAFDKNVFPPG